VTRGGERQIAAIQSADRGWRNRSGLVAVVGHPAKNQSRLHLKIRHQHNRNLGGEEGRGRRPRPKIVSGYDLRQHQDITRETLAAVREPSSWTDGCELRPSI
jgi:hypothetical protein